ncbi:MAG TPA: HAD-IC family P-type ATPase, partial [Dermatophilaceae bacterium]
MTGDETGLDGLDYQDGQAWYRMPVSELTTKLGVDVATGLDTGEAGRRRAQVGPNELAETTRRGPWRALGDQFSNLLIIILMVAAVVAGLIGDFKDAIIIVIVLVFNAVLGFYQEYRAERSLDALKRMLVAQARVRRMGEQVIVPAAELVHGDVVLLEAGDRVPADGRIVLASTAEVDESSLTGESIPMVKGVEPVTGDVVALADRTNMAFMNTVVTRGRLELVVTDTGMSTQMGELAQMLDHAESGRTPLQVQLDALGARLAVVAGIAVAVFFAFELLRGESLGGTLLNSVALAVAAIPEGLPAVVTVTLSVGTYALARRGAIVKQLASVETLGCTSVICSDKTGTLTVNQMTARRMYAAGSWFDISGEGYGNDGDIRPRSPEPAGSELHDLARSAVLCSDSVITDGQLIGDPTEGALLTLANKAGMDVEATRRAIPRLAEVPFDSSAKFMATFHAVDGRSHVFAKGAWEALLPRATRAAQGASTQRLTDDVVAAWAGAAEEMARSGLRVLVLASAEMPEGSDPTALGDTERSLAVSGLTLLGLVGLLDPPRPEARVAIARCASAGIVVKMITGAELDRLDDDQLRARIDDLGVFARVAPEHKVRIVTALQDHQRVVAMTGDGVNDAPALRQADIGVAMGLRGTDV